MGSKFTFGINRTLYYLAFITAILFFLVMLLVSVSVISRKFFGEPMAWSIEISEYFLVFLAFIPLGWVQKEGGHVRVDFLFNMFGSGVRVLIDAVYHGLGAFVWLIICIFSGSNAIIQAQRGILLMKMLNVPLWIPLAIIGFGSLILFIQLFRDTLKLIRAWRLEKQKD